jgi:hypothetical protein
MFAEMLKNLQNSTLLIPESQSYTLTPAVKALGKEFIMSIHFSPGETWEKNGLLG